ncbi:MAG TPA: tetratricopeptide repeat protein, partial [Tepidisphaeraceae bacterium]|nr:tetratricopeptide repeat protein [Tepidisphaeraceae bacterium]
DVRRQLMELYWRFNYAAETEDQAQALLKLKPNDPDALQYLLYAKLRLRGDEMKGNKAKNIASADEVVEQWLKAAPEDPQPYFWILQLMQQENRSSDEIVARAKKMTSAHPNDPLSELVVAEAYRMTNNGAEAVKLLKQAATQKMPSPEFAKMLAAELNAMHLYEDSLNLLQHQVNTKDDPSVAEALANREWEMGRGDKVIALTDGMKDKLSVQGKGILAISLYSNGKKDQAKAIAKDLSNTPGAVAKAWALILEQMDDPKSVTAQDIVQACQSALDHGGAQLTQPAYLQYFMAEAFAQIGENELAIDSLTKAVRENGTWAQPLLRLSNLELQRQRPAIALTAAAAAASRSRQTTAPIAIALAQAWAAESEMADKKPGSKAAPPEGLMKLVEEMHKKLPHEEHTLAMYISLLCQSEPPQIEKAKTELRNALSSDKNLSEQGLLSLAEVSRKYNLGMTDECFARVQKAFGMTPSLAYTQAVALYFKHDPAAGRKLLEQAKAKSGAADKVDWDLVWARYLELTNDPQAAKTWSALADANPNDLRIQQMVLQVPSVQSDRDLLARVIKRVKDLTGQDALTWKLAQARLTLRSNPSEQDLAKTSIQLKQIIAQAGDLAQPYALLGECYDRLGNLSEALAQLQTAAQKDPKNVQIALYYARLLQTHGDFDQASTVLQGISDDSLSFEERRQAAQLLTQQGNVQQAIDLLQPAAGQSEQNDLLLAVLYRQQNKTAEVSALCEKLLQHPDANAIAFAADFYASQGKMDLAEKTLAQLDKVKLAPGVREILESQFAARYQSVGQALKDLKAATESAPDNPVAWRQLIQLELTAGQIDATKQTLAQSKSSTAKDAALNVLRENEDLLLSLYKDPILRPSVLAVVADPESDDPLLAALKQVAAAKQSNDTPEKVAAAIRPLIDQYPHSLPVRVLVIQEYLAQQTRDAAGKAADLATQTAQLFPASTEPLQLATQSLMGSAQWSQALGYAKMWRQHSLENPVVADMAIAQIYAAMDQPVETASTIEPYIPQLLADPQSNIGQISLYCAAMNHTGNADKSAQILWPLVQKYPDWRRNWIALALQCNKESQSVQWLRRVQPEIADKDASVSAALAEAWQIMGNRYGNKEYLQTSQSMLNQILSRSDVAPETLQSIGVLEEQSGHSKEAEQIYRRAIKAKPDLAVALNNLAMIVARSGQNLPEAISFAEKAVAAAPKAATIYDTLAYVQAESKDYKAAISSIQHAVDIEPDNMLWRVHQVRYFWEDGEHKEAQNAAMQIDAMQPSNDSEGKKAAKEWSELKAQMNKQASIKSP